MNTFLLAVSCLSANASSAPEPVTANPVDIHLDLWMRQIMEAFCLQ